MASSREIRNYMCGVGMWKHGERTDMARFCGQRMINRYVYEQVLGPHTYIHRYIHRYIHTYTCTYITYIHTFHKKVLFISKVDWLNEKVLLGLLLLCGHWAFSLSWRHSDSKWRLSFVCKHCMWAWHIYRSFDLTKKLMAKLSQITWDIYNQYT